MKWVQVVPITCTLYVWLFNFNIHTWVPFLLVVFYEHILYIIDIFSKSYNWLLIEMYSWDWLFFFFKSILWDLVHGQNSFVRFTHQHILAFLLFVEHSNKHPQHGPHLVFIQCDLISKVFWAVKLSGKNDMFVCALRIGSRTETDLHLISTSQKRLSCPFCQFEGIIF